MKPTLSILLIAVLSSCATAGGGSAGGTGMSFFITSAGPGNGAAPTTLLTEDVVTGTGPTATQANTVFVRYTGTLWSDGSVFDSSWAGGDEPVDFPLAGVVPGFAQGIEGMAPGGRRVIVMPPELAYGTEPPPGYPAGALVFVVDLVSIS